MNRPTDDNDNRIRSIVDSVIGTESADDLMVDLMSAVVRRGGVRPRPPTIFKRGRQSTFRRVRYFFEIHWLFFSN